MQATNIDTHLRGLLPEADLTTGNRIPPSSVPLLPRDTVDSGLVPAGVHLAMMGTTQTVRLAYRMGTATTRHAPDLLPTITIRVGHAAAEIALQPGEHEVEFVLPPHRTDEVVRLYLPETHAFEPLALTSEDGGTIAAPPARPRWVVYGDSISQGWSVSRAGSAWPSLVAEELSLALVNFGFAGAARGELEAAAAVARSGADAVTLAWGTNAWSTIPTSAPLIAETLRAFVATVRTGLPDVPISVVSPIVRPDAEATPNRLGATLADLRAALEKAAADLAGVSLAPGYDLLKPDELVDGIHPGDEGHATLAAVLTPVIRDQLGR